MEKRTIEIEMEKSANGESDDYKLPDDDDTNVSDLGHGISASKLTCVTAMSTNILCKKKAL